MEDVPETSEKEVDVSAHLLYKQFLLVPSLTKLDKVC